MYLISAFTSELNLVWILLSLCLCRFPSIYPLVSCSWISFISGIHSFRDCLLCTKGVKPACYGPVTAPWNTKSCVQPLFSFFLWGPFSLSPTRGQQVAHPKGRHPPCGLQLWRGHNEQLHFSCGTPYSYTVGKGIGKLVHKWLHEMLCGLFQTQRSLHYR